MPVRPWVPTDITNDQLEGWWYVRNPFKPEGTLVRDGDKLNINGATGLGNAGLVNGWLDASGKGRDLVQTTAARKPSATNDAFSSGRQGIVFNSSFFHFLEVSSFALQKRIGLSIAMNRGTNAAAAVLSVLGTLSNADVVLPHYFSTASAMAYRIPASATGAITTVPATTPLIVEGYPISASQLVFRMDGATSGGLLDASQSSSLSRLRIGGSLVPPGGAPTNPFNGTLAEIVMTSEALISDDRLKLQGYMAWNNGTQGRLASTHPYKNEAPIIDADYPATVPMPEYTRRRRLVGVN